MRLFTFILTITLFCFATCKPNQEKLPEVKWIDFWDVTSLGTPDSLKYLLPILDSVYKKDQYYRTLVSATDEENNHNFSNKLLWKKIEEWDRENLIVVEKIIAKHGFLGYKDVGTKAATAIFMVIQHADIKTREKYLTQINRAMKEKNILGPHYAMYIDRLNKAQHKPQKYGTQLLVYKDTKPELYPLLNADSVDYWRDEIKMYESMEKYLGRFKIKWNIEDYKKQHPTLIKKYKVMMPNK